jgi:TIR domain
MPEDVAGRPVVVFMSYRRGDTQWAARTLYQVLAGKYGRENVFRDLDAVPAGARFRDLIERKIAESSVFVLLIGKTWASYTDAAGRRRLELPRDPVRLEVESALRLGIPIIPVRVEGAPMPTEEDLVPSIVDLLEFNAAEVTESRWEYDVGKLLQAIAETAERGREPPKPDTTAEPILSTGPSRTQPAPRVEDQAAPGAPPAGNPSTMSIQDPATPPSLSDAPVETRQAADNERGGCAERRHPSDRNEPNRVSTSSTRGQRAVLTRQVAARPQKQEPSARGQPGAGVPVRRRSIILALAATLGSIALFAAYLVSMRAMEAQILSHLPADLRASCTATGSESATCGLTDGTIVFFRLFDTAAEAHADVVDRNEVAADGTSCPSSAPTAGASVTCRYTVGGQSGTAAFSYTAKGNVRSFRCRWVGDNQPRLRGEMATANANPEDWAALRANWNQLSSMG